MQYVIGFRELIRRLLVILRRIIDDSPPVMRDVKLIGVGRIVGRHILFQPLYVTKLAVVGKIIGVIQPPLYVLQGNSILC